jgi:hypothetical protein
MIYQSPPELGALFTEVEQMTKELGKQQKELIARQMRDEQIRLKRRKQRMAKYQFEFAVGLGILFMMIVMGGFFMWVAHDAQQRWGSVTSTRYRDTLERVRKEEWFEHQKKLQDYELFLQNQQREKSSESSN